jgi:hypothetical protein
MVDHVSAAEQDWNSNQHRNQKRHLSSPLLIVPPINANPRYPFPVSKTVFSVGTPVLQAAPNTGRHAGEGRSSVQMPT